MRARRLLPAALAALLLGPAAPGLGAEGDIFTLAGLAGPFVPGQPGLGGGDRGPATRAGLFRPSDVSRAADRSVLIADPVQRRIRRVAPDGRISTVAGTGQGGIDGDGGPATAARIGTPVAVSVAPDGGFLLADQFNDRIRRVAPDGTITTVAGVVHPPGAEGGFSGDGGPAVAAELNSPSGVVATPDGGFLISDAGNMRVRRVGPDGTIATVAGNGARVPSGDGGPATAAGLGVPQGIAVPLDGGFLAATGDRVRRVSPAGVITTVAGGGRLEVGPGGKLATDVRIGAVDVARESTGAFLIADARLSRVYRVSPVDRIATIAGDPQASRLNLDGTPARKASLAIQTLAVTSSGSDGYLVAAGRRVRLVVGRAIPALAIAHQPRRAWTAPAGARLRVPYAVTRGARVRIEILRRRPAPADRARVGSASALARPGPDVITVRMPTRPSAGCGEGCYVLRLTARRSDGAVAVDERPLTVRPRR